MTAPAASDLSAAETGGWGPGTDDSHTYAPHADHSHSCTPGIDHPHSYAPDTDDFHSYNPHTDSSPSLEHVGIAMDIGAYPPHLASYQPAC